MNTEDIWQSFQGPTSLVELAVEQKETNCELVEHHYSLCVILHAVFAFSLRSVKPLSFYDTKVNRILTNLYLSSRILRLSVLAMLFFC